MFYSPHQLTYFAHRLTLLSPSDSAERMAGPLLDAQVDLNPHQIDAALFATGNPLAKGALLADEVGLGKTIEAGLVIAQRWAERRRRILVIVPANLRKQWHQELADKFGLQASILDAQSYRQETRDGNLRPFDVSGARERIVICSYQFAAARADEVATVAWDLVVLDEAHRLRNVYKPDNKIARALKDALGPARKVLLTATPLQNTLLELYGLVSFIDEQVFGDVESFRQQFGTLRDAGSFALLKRRIAPLCQRTLRRQVEAYVKYTRRSPLLQEFHPGPDEARLYHLVSDYLQRDSLHALPNSQRQLITLVLRKLLASSTFAIAGALDTLARRLRRSLEADAPEPLDQALAEDYEALAETAEELAQGEEDGSAARAEQRAAVLAEVAELEGFRDLATSITENAKGLALLRALDVAFARLRELGAPEKAIIFTESRRTQDYLLRLLGATRHGAGVVLFNGSNSDAASRRIYADWLTRHRGSDRITGSRSADTRAALVEYFREQGSVMIATEAGAEGINLQFCSLVINYDLPWNPQRIEQRIGRCHRYGQRHDVVVVNFLNLDNDADRRVYQLLDEKFRLFDGVFGASDEVLGALESGVDFERRIADIYQRCREPAAIHRAFEQLQLDLAGEINEAMLKARQALLENFDEDVQRRLKLAADDARLRLGRLEELLMRFTRGMLVEAARFDADGLGFELLARPETLASQSMNPDSVPLGRYELPRRSETAHVYRLQHPLAQGLLAAARAVPLAPAQLRLDYEAYGAQVAALKALRGQRGSVAVRRLRVRALGAVEEYLLAVASCGEATLDSELTDRLLSLPGRLDTTLGEDGSSLPSGLSAALEAARSSTLAHVEARNLALFAEESDKLDTWADDLKLGLERELKDLDRRIKETRTRGKGAATLAEKLDAQKAQRELEATRDRKRRELFIRQDEIQARRDRLIEDLECQLAQSVEEDEVLNCSWVMV